MPSLPQAAIFLINALVMLVLTSPAWAADGRFLLLQSTTSTRDSGLYDFILPKFTEQAGIEVRVVAVGTGQALRNARNGDGDLIIVHARDREIEFVEHGYGDFRCNLMYNDFVIVGPDDDPADIRRAMSAEAAFRRIASARAPFASRGDDSGTHIREKGIWNAAGIDPEPSSGTWYRETGSGMGATLNSAIGMDAYTLSDRGTWLSFANKQAHQILFAGADSLRNQYGVILVSAKRHPHIRTADALALIQWLTGPSGQQAIGEFRIGDKQLFHPNANTSNCIRQMRNTRR